MSLTDSLGALYLANLFSLITEGILLTKVWEYFSGFPRDRIIFKLIAGAAMIAGTLDTVGLAVWSYDLLITHFGDPSALATLGWHLVMDVFLVGATTMLAQVFFAWRIWKISGQTQLVIPILIILLTLLQFGTVLWVMSVTIETHLMSSIAECFPRGYTWLVGSVVGDALCTGGMIYYLLYKTSSEMTAARVSFQMIVRRAVQNNALAFCIQLAQVIMFRAAPGMWFFLPHFQMTKAYSLSIIMSLTSRRPQTSSGTSNYESDFGVADGTTRLTKGQRSQTGTGVQVTVIKDSTVDDAWRTQQDNFSKERQAVNVTFGNSTHQDLERKRRDEEHELDSF